MRDLNAHHSLWHDPRNDNAGVALAQAISDYNLVVLNDGVPTHLALPTQTPSIIDLSLVSPDLAILAQASTMGNAHGSDHFPIEIIIEGHFDPPLRFRYRLPLRKEDYRSLTISSTLTELRSLQIL